MKFKFKFDTRNWYLRDVCVCVCVCVCVRARTRILKYLNKTNVMTRPPDDIRNGEREMFCVCFEQQRDWPYRPTAGIQLHAVISALTWQS